MQVQAQKATCKGWRSPNPLKGLGWNVDLRTHKGWNGALNRGGQDGESAPYFASYNYEVSMKSSEEFGRRTDRGADRVP